MIRTIHLLLFFVFLVFSIGSVLAQEDESPAKPEQRKIKTMIDYRDELGLSDEQVKEVSTALLAFQNTVKQLRTDLAQYEQDYKKLLDEEAPLSDIKSKLKQIATVRFQLRYADVLTSRRVSSALTDEQMARWREIQGKVRADQK